MLDYETIKKIAKKHGLRVTDLLAMAPKNDPFYTGTPRDVQMAEWFGRIWKMAGYTSGVHLRRAHYWCVSQGGLPMHTGDPYENTTRCWQYLVQAAKVARYMGVVDISAIADHKNPAPIIHADLLFDYTRPDFRIIPPDIERPEVDLRLPAYADVMPALCEVWVEKSTMNDVLEPVCERYHANLVTFEGEASITAVDDLAWRILEANRPARIFYISDHDPAGNSMPKAVARKLEWLMGHHSIVEDVCLQQLALTPEQVEQYRLPRTPIKRSEKRAANFEEAFGTGAVELDALEALHPGVLADIVADALEEYYDQEAADEVDAKRSEALRRIGREVRKVLDRYEVHIEALEEMADELLAIDVDLSDLDTATFDLEVDEYEEDWLFDSERKYADQIAYYKEHAGKDSVFAATG